MAAIGNHDRHDDSDLAGEREGVAFQHITDALAAEYDDHAREEVERAVEEVKENYDDAAVRNFVPILVEREVRETLKESD